MQPEVDLGIESELEEYSWSIEEDIKQAEEQGFEVIRSTDKTLLLDLDDGASQDRYHVMLGRLQSLFGLKEVSRWPSKSGRGLHVVVACDVLSFQERVTLQACLGSDPIREALAIAMAAAGKENPSVLFKPPVRKS